LPTKARMWSSPAAALPRTIGHFISIERYHASSLFRSAENVTSRCASIAASRWDRTRGLSRPAGKVTS
jgi:hypothetical protein